MICWTVCWPSQRSTISRLGPFKRRARSGMSSTRCWLFSPRRHPGARRGRLVSSGGIVGSSRFPCRLERAGGRPAGIDVSKIERVELSPEDVALGAQRGVGQILFHAGACVFYDPGQGEVGVLGSLREAACEIVETAREPGVVFAEAIHAQDDQFFREEFGKGRSDGFEVRSSGYEINVCLDGETRGRKNAIAAEGVFARKAGGFHETQPLLDAAGLGAITIVIEDALAPGETKRWVVATRENCGVFNGYSALIGVAIEGPGLKLATRELAFVHEQVKRVLVMVALFADGMKDGDERELREERLFDGVVHGWVHRLNSIPS